MNRKIIFLLLLLTVDCVSAIGISPSLIELPVLSRGANVEKTVQLSGLGPGDIVTIKTDGEASDWISFMSDEFEFPETASLEVRFTIDVPKTAGNGYYFAKTIFLVTGRSVAGNATMSVVPGVALRFRFKVVGEQIVDYRIEHIAVHDTEVGYPIILEYRVENNGNVIGTPALLEISIRKDDDIIRKYNLTELAGAPPYSSTTLNILVENTLQAGDYWMNARFFDGVLLKDEFLQFTVYEAGYLQKTGRLLLLETPPSVILGSVFKLIAWFENTGSLPITGKFKGEIYKGPELVKIIESDSLGFMPDEVGSFVSYFEPIESGRYTLVGHIIYDGKKTEKRTTKLIVNDNSKGGPEYFIFAAILVAALMSFVIWRWRR